jgi:hypothetical protein
MWDVASSLDDGLMEVVSADTTWKVSQVRLEFGPARTIGDLLAALSEVMNYSRIAPYDLEFLEAPEGTYMYTHCELPHLDAGVYDVLAPLVSREPAPRY